MTVTKEEGLEEIDGAKWVTCEGYLLLLVRDAEGRPQKCMLTHRPDYCDRGHLMLQGIDGHFDLDAADRFPRYFFSFEEADKHTRAFLRWRIWKVRAVNI